MLKQLKVTNKNKMQLVKEVIVTKENINQEFQLQKVARKIFPFPKNYVPKLQNGFKTNNLLLVNLAINK